MSMPYNLSLKPTTYWTRSMNNITSITNPLMQIIQYNGRAYFSGQYFHQTYRNNSDTNGKYKQAAHFFRLIRSIETYQDYINGGDIVELIWKEVKQSTDPDMGSVKHLFKTTQYKPIISCRENLPYEDLDFSFN